MDRLYDELSYKFPQGLQASFIGIPDVLAVLICLAQK